MIAAIGQRPGTDAKMGLALNQDGAIKLNPDTLETSLPGIFAGGDAALGPASVIEAIAMGRKAAIAIDRSLGGKGVIDEKLAPETAGMKKLPRPEETGERKRPGMKYLNAGQRIKGFRQVECGYSKQQSTKEASRCLQCDLEEK